MQMDYCTRTKTSTGIQELNQDCIMLRFSKTQTGLNWSREIDLKQQEKCFCPVNRYNGSVIVITVHLDTQKYSKTKTFSKKPE
jgi:hypothetical protein